jgi:hypothetical protein
LGVVASGAYVEAIDCCLAEYCVLEGRYHFSYLVSEDGVPFSLLLEFVEVELVSAHSRYLLFAFNDFLNVIFGWFFHLGFEIDGSTLCSCGILVLWV